MAIKRSREEEITVEALAMANCVNILQNNSTSQLRRFFECKTCNKRFESFQALGGHRASHKKLKLVSPIKSTMKKHKCSYCGEEFVLGQALGGHMRKHRDKLEEEKKEKITAHLLKPKGKIVNRDNGKKFCLDLNLTPYENDQLTLGIIPFTVVHSLL